MRADIVVTVRRGDGTTLIREISVETNRLYKYGGWVAENRAEFRQRLDRHVKTALNATVGGNTKR